MKKRPIRSKGGNEEEKLNHEMSTMILNKQVKEKEVVTTTEPSYQSIQAVRTPVQEPRGDKQILARVKKYL
jgi:hypothetical protein